jgi:hypothetical protein
MKAVISPFPIEEALQRYARAGLPRAPRNIFGASQ